ncbi:hypothetical protein FN846DRAFT_191151 [Sphaerosporella brunnea]|uniref:Endoplasmic reticulum junction formation protein lunapark n=1 Tax=Sphaerosporella brunnea TaxID=1250544 RepID=A0A5J5EPR1_9PEZI|nr:hypothetical protein FN846DRAFT_191151 [Sphaerosporella brunnea]
MVRLWPFRGDDNSPDSFERILVKLASQIEASSSKLAILRQRSRRYKALFTIYSVLGFILYIIVIVLVVGYQNVGLQEGSGLLVGPFAIYFVRKSLDLYYERRITSAETRLEDLQTQQRATIEKLKAATKFSTTQSLIEKYGGTSSGISQSVENQKTPSLSAATSASESTGPQQRMPHQPQPQPQLSQLANTLTPDQMRVQQQLLAQQKAGIPPQYGQVQAQGQPPRGPQPPFQQRLPQTLHMQGHTQPPSQQHLQPEEATAPRWYDRILDVVLGEDETSAKNRFALICKNCRMVNGLAPPGTRSLNEMDEWGCARCGTMNGAQKQRAIEVKHEEKESLLEPSLVDIDDAPNRRSATASLKTKSGNSASEVVDEKGKEVADAESDKEELRTPKSKAKLTGRKQV